jgi:hypothetical protein
MTQSIYGAITSSITIQTPSSADSKTQNPQNTIDYITKAIDILSTLALKGSSEKKTALERLVVLQKMIQLRMTNR